MTKLALRLFVVVMALCISALSPATAQNAPKVVRTAINPIIYSNLPMLIAIEKGYFKEEGIDLKVAKYNGSSVTQMPLLARGDLADYHLAHSARADLLRRLGCHDDAVLAYRRALALVQQQPERRFLIRRLGELGAEP